VNSDHADHTDDVEKLTEEPVDPVAGFPRDKFYCWECGVGWSA